MSRGRKPPKSCHALPVIQDGRTDAELVAAHRAGDRAAAGVLLGRHQGMVLRNVGRLKLPPTVEREDLVQAGFLAVLRCAGPTGWSPERLTAAGRPVKFSTYAFTAARNSMLRALEAHDTVQETTGNIELYEDKIPAPEPIVHDGPELPPNLSLIGRALASAVLTDGVSLNAAAADYGLTLPQAKKILASELGREWSPPRPSRQEPEPATAA